MSMTDALLALLIIVTLLGYLPAVRGWFKMQLARAAKRRLRRKTVVRPLRSSKSD